MPGEQIVEQYMTLGALGVSFITLMGIIVAWVKSISPTLNGMRDALDGVKLETNNHQNTLANNTAALVAVAHSVEEVAKSNDNVAAMVSILSTSLETQARLIEKHDIDTDKRLTSALAQLQLHQQELIKSIEKNGDNNDKQHGDISTALTRHDDRSQRIETEVGRVKGKCEIILTKLE